MLKLKIKDLPLDNQEPISKWLAKKYEVKIKAIKSIKQTDYDLWLSHNYPCSS